MIIPDDIKLISKISKSVPLLKQPEEKALAQDIVRSRIEVWGVALSYKSATKSMLEFLMPFLSDDKTDLTPILKLMAMPAQNYRKKEVDDQINEAAKLIAGMDLNLAIFEKLQKEWSNKKPFGKNPPRNSQIFADYKIDLKNAVGKHRSYKERFWKANIRLVLSIAKKSDYNMVPFADILQEGLIGLMTAVERFDPERGLRFSTYGTWWIRHGINRFLANHGRAIRWPAYLIVDFEQLKRSRNNLMRKGIVPTLETLQQESGFDAKKVQKILDLGVTFPLSLEAQMPGFESSETLKDRVREEQLGIEENEIYFDPGWTKVQKELLDLPGIEADILIKRFGLNGQDPMTLQEIASEHDLCRERIRQLERQGLMRLKESVGA